MFLAAGCPMSIRHSETNEPLIPDVQQLTTAVFQSLDSSEHGDSFKTVLGHFVSDGKDLPNIETFLSHVRALRNVAGQDEVRGIGAADLVALDQAACHRIVEIVSKCLPHADTAYHKLAAWVGAIQRAHPVELFTTNYDLLLEEALEANRIPYFDGFVGSRLTFFDTHAMEEDVLPARWARLWKLHGSINWQKDDQNTVRRGQATSPIEHCLIHPSHLKYDESRRMPYLAMIDRLRSFLRRPNSVLVISGYSFGDDHLNEVLIQGLQGNATAVVYTLLYGPLNNYPKAIRLASSRANLTLLANDEAVIGTRRGPWSAEESEELKALPFNPVQWVAAATDSDETRTAFTLGDFANLGRFLEDLIGTEPRKEGSAHV